MLRTPQPVHAPCVLAASADTPPRTSGRGVVNRALRQVQPHVSRCHSSTQSACLTERASLRCRASPGLNFAIPLIESVAYKRSLKETTFPIHPQTAITRDNVHVQLDGAVYAKVEDAYRASYGIDSPNSASAMIYKVVYATRDEGKALSINSMSDTQDNESVPRGVSSLTLFEIGTLGASPGVVLRLLLRGVLDLGAAPAQRRRRALNALRAAQLLQLLWARAHCVRSSHGSHLITQRCVCTVLCTVLYSTVL